MGSAIECFAVNGIGDAYLRRIAGSMGSSHRLLIYLFRSCAGLLEAVVDELEKSERDILTHMLNQPDGTAARTGDI
ncbi:hypothetical protein EV651_11223 [Kribbella sp. VKM Ac-2571]|uniref:hypothetical protein n=1 Tax=Kribbella sp. VKM Ac-2571 TaxID=2512222 RepID=UPI0010611D08|nr:hypothetical protein [Kribbella sp. VKM Ac-2571]TDO56636.1 hypothetical protein EV651_11223 [Kribbella sp. VKM Ac-2571]